MKRIGNFAKRASAIFALCAAVAVALPAHTFITLLSFDGANGELPYASLIQGINGDLYGTTYAGGSHGGGTVFKMTSSGATSVTFNGIPATAFTVNSTNSAISTTVPAGATSGTVQVVTPTGTLLSNGPFRVIP
jgi:uncharacterized repeat protein (TIGR03803 family)